MKPFTKSLFSFVFYSFIIGLTASCVSNNQEKNQSIPDNFIRYAKGFSVRNDGNIKWVEVSYPYQNASSGYKYALIPQGAKVPPHEEDVQIVEIPLKNIVCTSTTHIPLLDYLNLTQKLIGFPTTDYISSPSMRARIDSGRVLDLGADKGMNLEKLFVLKPSAVMGYTMTADLGQLKKIREFEIPVILNAEYLEKHPLGRAEWIKFVSLFFNKEKEADSIFTVIESEYLATKKLVEKSSAKPTVMSGIVYGDTWFLPGGKNYAAKLLDDSGCKYIWSADSTRGFLELSFETVFAKAKEADLWIGVGSFKSLADLKAAEDRYTLFKPFTEKNVFTYDARHGAKGGSEFLELGYLRPDIILKDLVKISHPEMLPNHELYFHKKLD